MTQTNFKSDDFKIKFIVTIEGVNSRALLLRFIASTATIVAVGVKVALWLMERLE
jgi:hypothetical protein